MTEAEIRADQQRLDAELVLEDCRRNWMYGRGGGECTHTILAKAILEGKVPEKRISA